MELLTNINEVFWSRSFWLPPAETWEDRKSTPENQFPDFDDLKVYPLIIGLVLTIIRFFILNPFVYRPLIAHLGIRDVRPRNVIPNAILETSYRRYKNRIPKRVIDKCSVETAWNNNRQVERWFRARLAMDRVNTHSKCLESLWQLCFYAFIMTFGFFVCYDKIWLYDIRHVFLKFPHKLDNEVWWYYMISLGFYYSMTVTHFLESRRKDFYQMLAHHVITIILICFSWTCNFTRIGALVIFVHDLADAPGHICKLSLYFKWKKASDFFFVFFLFIWVVTRCLYFPAYIIWVCAVYSPTVLVMHPIYYIFCGLLVCLAFLHYFWTYMLTKAVFKFVINGEVADNRSSDDELYEKAEALNGDVLQNKTANGTAKAELKTNGHHKTN